MKAKVIAGIFAALIALIALAALASAQERPLYFIITGQSNAAPQGDVAQLPAGQQAVEGAWYYAPQVTKTWGWKPMSAYGRKFGVAIPFAKAIREACPNRTVLVANHFSGGTSIIAWQEDAPNAAWTRAMKAVGNVNKKPQWPRVMAVDVAARSAWGEPLSPSGILWIQGEKDSRSSYGAARYDENLRRLIANFRQTFNDPALPVVFMDSHAFLSNGGEVVHNAIVAVASSVPNTAWVVNRDLSKVGAHFDADGTVVLGKRMAAAWLAIEGCD